MPTLTLTLILALILTLTDHVQQITSSVLLPPSEPIIPAHQHRARNAHCVAKQNYLIEYGVPHHPIDEPAPR